MTVALQPLLHIKYSVQDAAPFGRLPRDVGPECIRLRLRRRWVKQRDQA